MELKCKLHKSEFRTYKESYKIKNQILIDSKWNKCLTCVGEDVDEESSKLIKAVFFNKCVMRKLPNRLSHAFPNLELLSVVNCGLIEITRDDLKNLTSLKHLLLNNNELQSLPSDLFADRTEIEKISFKSNKLHHVGSNILDPLTKLQSADFRNNLKINMKYSIPRFMGEEIRKLSAHRLDKLQRKMRKIEKCDVAEPGGLKLDIEKFLLNDDFKDFNVKLNDKEFRVHKFLLAARSPVMSELMKQEPDAESITLIDIPTESFETILDFIYDENFPNDDVILETYAAAALLEILELKAFAASRLMTSLNDENALTIFTMANKYMSEDLKLKAFEQIRTFCPNRKLCDELADNPDAVRKLISAKNEIEKLTQE